MDDRLLTFGLGTFHLLLFLTVLIALLHVVDGMQALLVLGTGPGVLVFVLLWAGTVFFTGAALQGESQRGHPVRAAAFWGAAEGLVIALVLVGVTAVRSGPFALFVLAVGVPVAMLVGALVGLGLAGVDRLLLPDWPPAGPGKRFEALGEDGVKGIA